MRSENRSVRPGWVKGVLLGAVCLLAGLAVGRWVLPKKPAGEKTWQEVDELHQMFLVPSGYNFVESNKSYENQLLALIHDSLLRFDPVQNQFVPALAKSYESSPDGLVWTFHLRDARTPDGDKLTADDVVFSFNLCLDKRFDCKQSGNLIFDNKPVGVKAADPLTVVFTLPTPYWSFPWSVSGVFVAPRKTFAEAASNEKSFREAVGVEQPDLKYLRGFGPFFVEALDTQEVVLARNDRFWGRGDDRAPRPRLGRIVLLMRKNNITADADFVRDDRLPYRVVGPRQGTQLRKDSDFQVIDRGVSGYSMIFWLNQNPRAPWAKTFPGRMALFQKIDFRRALSHAIDRQAIIDRVFLGYAEPLYGPGAPVYRWAAPEDLVKEVCPKTDRQAALAELAKVGVTPGEPEANGKRWLTYDESGKREELVIELRTSPDAENLRRATAEEIAAQLGEIGLRIKVVEENFGDLVTRFDKSYDYEASVMFLEGSPDLATMRHFFVSSGPMHFVNPYQKSPGTEWERQVDEAFKRFATAPEESARLKAAHDMQRIWVQAQPNCYLLNDRRLVAVRRDYEINGMALTGRAGDPILERTVIENVRLRRLVPR